MAATPQDQLVDSEKSKTFKGISAQQIAQMETEMANLQREMKLIEDSYGPNHLNLVLARGYLVTLSRMRRSRDTSRKTMVRSSANFVGSRRWFRWDRRRKCNAANPLLEVSVDLLPGSGDWLV